jgi:cytochrome P450
MRSLDLLQGPNKDWVILFFVALLAYQSISAIYHLYFSPLAKIPGPFLAKISTWPSFYHAVKCDRHIWIWQCFEIYGNKVRVAPNTVLFNTPKAFRDIYSHKANVKKAKSYDAWQRHAGDANTLNSSDVAIHAKKRKVLNTVFTDRSLRSAAPFIIKHIDRWNELTVMGHDWSEPIDFAKWVDCLIFDILGDLCFGKSFGVKEPGENPFKVIPEVIVSYMRLWNPVSKSPLLDAIVWLKPRGLNRVLEWLTPKEIKRYYTFVDQRVTERIEDAIAVEKSGQDQHERKDMFHYLYEAKDAETGRPAYSREELLAEANLLVIAGSDTTSVSLSGFFFYITHYPHVYAKLVKHIRSSFASIDEIVEGRQLSSCQYLRACLDEALRLTPAGPSELARTVLAGGLQVDGEFFPEGTCVGTTGWSSGRNEETYGDANTYRPERWIVDEENGVSAESVAFVKSCLHPFSAGPGNCVGQNLAILEMLLVIARTLYRMDVRLAPGSTLGEGAPELGWGRRNKNLYQLEDAYISLRHGPMLQFRRRSFEGST